MFHEFSVPTLSDTVQLRRVYVQLELIKQKIDTVPYADYIYAMCYLNFRVSEFLELTSEQYKVSENGIPYLIGGKKTDAGKDRIVPIHPKIQDIVKKCVDKGGETIFLPTRRLCNE